MSIYRPYTLCVTFWHCSGPEQWNFFCSGPEWCWSVIYLGVLRLYLNRCKSTHHGCSYKGVLSVNLFYGSVGCGFRLSIAVVIPLSSHSHTHTHGCTHTHTHTHMTYKKKSHSSCNHVGSFCNIFQLSSFLIIISAYFVLLISLCHVFQCNVHVTICVIRPIRSRFNLSIKTFFNSIQFNEH